MDQFEFFEYYPENTTYVCPPEDSNVHSGTLYRYSTEKGAVCARDFQLAIESEIFVQRNRDNLVILCQGGGLSSFVDRESAKESLVQLRKNVPGMKNKFKGIHQIEISETDGVLKETPSQNSKNHYTWWSNKGIDYLNRAVFVEAF